MDNLNQIKKKTIVVIGGGTAGLNIANNLQDYFNVIVVEKSKHKKYPLIFKIPLLIGLLFRSSDMKYIHRRELVLQNGRRIPFFESNVLGGASVINGCVHVIGSQKIWNVILERFNSSYEALMESYDSLYTKRKMESNKINLMLAPQNIIDHAFLKALNFHGVLIGDTNFSNKENCGQIYNTTKKLFRTSILSLLHKKDFKLLMGKSVKRIVFDENYSVTAVETTEGIIKTDYVVLSAGVIGTCSLLLSEKNNKTSNYMSNLDIGDQVKDHTNIRVNVKTKKEIGSLNEIEKSFFKKLVILIKHCLGIPTVMVGTGATSCAHLDLNGDGEVDTRIQVVQFIETGRHGSDGKYFSDEPGFSLSITLINPASKGSIWLNGEKLIVDPKYLSNKLDIDLLKLSLTYCLKLLRSHPFNTLVKEILDEDLIESNPEKYICENIFSGHHLIGGAQNVVDSDFKVKGLNGLYVCDASIFNEYAASNIHSSVILISDIFSKKLMLNRY